MSSGYEIVVVGKLRLKGKALDIESSSGIKKKKKKHMSRHYHHELLHHENNFSSDSITENLNKDNGADEEKLTPAERQYMQRWKQIEMQRLAKFASKSHRQRIEEFNQYLANLTEHYDIPKVGPG